MGENKKMKKKDIVKLLEKEGASYDELFELEQRIEIKRDSKLDSELRTAAGAEVDSLLHDHDSLLYDRFATRFGKDIDSAEGLKADLSNIRPKPDEQPRPVGTRRNWNLIGAATAGVFGLGVMGTIGMLYKSPYSIYQVAANPVDLSSPCDSTSEKVTWFKRYELDSWVYNTYKMHYGSSDSAGVDLLICNSKDCNDSNAIYFAKDCGVNFDIGKAKVWPSRNLWPSRDYAEETTNSQADYCSIQKKEFLSSPPGNFILKDGTIIDVIDLPSERERATDTSSHVAKYTASVAPLMSDENASRFYHAAKDLASCMNPEMDFDSRFVETTFHIAANELDPSNGYGYGGELLLARAFWVSDDARRYLKHGERVCEAYSLDCTESARGVAEAAYNGILLMREAGYNIDQKEHLELIETIAEKHGFSAEYAPKIASLREQ